MRDRLRRLSWKVELVIVLALAFGWTIPATLRFFRTSPALAEHSSPLVTDSSLWQVVFLELVVLCLLIPFLRVRGWTPSRLGIRPSLRGSLIGIFLALIAYGIYFRLAALVGHLWHEIGHTLTHTHIVGWGYSWTAVILTSIINSFYEETFVCGYVISVLTEQTTSAQIRSSVVASNNNEDSANPDSMQLVLPPRARVASLAAAVAISIAIRLFYHLYQGMAGVLVAIPVGLLFGIWFARTRQLWPLMVAHAIMDFVALAARAG